MTELEEAIQEAAKAQAEFDVVEAERLSVAARSEQAYTALSAARMRVDKLVKEAIQPNRALWPTS